MSDVQEETVREEMSSDGALLTPEAVMNLLISCLGVHGERGDLIRMFGIDYVLDVRGKEEEIARLLMELPHEFRPERGYAHSLIGALFDKDGRVWADGLPTAMHLLALGTAAGMVEECFQPSLRPSLPAGVPYYKVKV